MKIFLVIVTVQASLDSGEVVQRELVFEVFDQNDAPENLEVSTTLSKRMLSVVLLLLVLQDLIKIRVTF